MSFARFLRRLFLIALCLAAAAVAPGAAPHWVKIALLTPEQKAAGIFPGGEGAQWPRGPIAVSPADPDFLLLPIDVGGVYRSLDGGRHWDIAMVGWNARGANGFGIDPRNAQRAIGIAANSMNWNPAWGPSPHGLYLSTDRAASWKQVLALTGAFGGIVAFDPTSYDPGKGFCTVVYYLSPGQGLFRSENGGGVWERLKTAPEPGFHPGGDWSEGIEVDPKLAVDPRTGAVYIAGAEGLFRSSDRGETWTHPRVSSVYGLSLAPDGTVCISGPDRISLSHDGGRTWTQPACAGLETAGGRRIQDLVVSPADPRRMLCWTSGKSFVWPRYVTADGGATWQTVRHEHDGAVLPLNGRQGYSVWSPKDPDVAWSIGGDWVIKSTDGGKTFRWSNNGYNGIMTGGAFNFNLRNPQTVFIGFQDYNGAFTTDGGKTWNYRDISGKGWGGHEYGAFALSQQVMWAGDGDSWYTPRHLRLTRDGGKTWTFVNGADGKPLDFKGADISNGDPTDPHVGFAGSLRTADAGVTWQRMEGCEGVYAFDPSTHTLQGKKGGFVTPAKFTSMARPNHALYGKKGDAIVRSFDHGVKWETVATVEGGFGDLALDPVRGRIYVASEDRLKIWEAGKWTPIDTPADQYGNARVWTVATDPQDPAVVYVGGPRNTYATQATVCRSTDGGRTWTNLTVTTPLGKDLEGGPHEVSAIRVNPVTREAWVAGQCFGLWKIAAPKPGEIGKSAAAASAPRAAAAPTID